MCYIIKEGHSPEQDPNTCSTPVCVFCGGSHFHVLDLGLAAIALGADHHSTHQAHGRQLAVIALRAGASTKQIEGFLLYNRPFPRNKV